MRGYMLFIASLFATFLLLGHSCDGIVFTIERLAPLVSVADATSPVVSRTSVASIMCSCKLSSGAHLECKRFPNFQEAIEASFLCSRELRVNNNAASTFLFSLVKFTGNSPHVTNFASVIVDLHVTIHTCDI